MGTGHEDKAWCFSAHPLRAKNPSSTHTGEPQLLSTLMRPAETKALYPFTLNLAVPKENEANPTMNNSQYLLHFT